MRIYLSMLVVVSILLSGCTALNGVSTSIDNTAADMPRDLAVGTELTYVHENLGQFTVTVEKHNAHEMEINVNRAGGVTVDKNTLGIVEDNSRTARSFFPLSAIVENDKSVNLGDIRGLLKTGERIEFADGSTIRRQNQYEQHGVPVTELSFSDPDGQTMVLTVTTENPYLIVEQEMNNTALLQLQEVHQSNE